MPPVMPSAEAYFSPRLWTGVINDIPLPKNYLYQQLLGQDQPVAGDRLAFDVIKAENELAPFVAVDAESPRFSDEIMTEMFADIAYIRHKKALKESDVRLLRSLGSAPIAVSNGYLNAMADQAKARIARTAARLNAAVEARKEWMTINACLGAINYTPAASAVYGSPVKFSLTYPVQTVTAGTLWSDTVNSDPIGDLQNWFLNLTYPIDRVIMGRQVWYNLERNKNVLNRLFSASATANQPLSITQGVVKNFLAGEMGLDALFYDARYTTKLDNGTVQTISVNKFLPDNKIIFLPAQKIGYMATAPAPLNNWQPGKFAWVRDPDNDPSARDPWVYELGAGFYGLPILEYAPLIIVATVG